MAYSETIKFLEFECCYVWKDRKYIGVRDFTVPVIDIFREFVIKPIVHIGLNGLVFKGGDNISKAVPTPIDFFTKDGFGLFNEYQVCLIEAQLKTPYDFKLAYGVKKGESRDIKMVDCVISVDDIMNTIICPTLNENGFKIRAGWLTYQCGNSEPICYRIYKSYAPDETGEYVYKLKNKEY